MEASATALVLIQPWLFIQVQSDEVSPVGLDCREEEEEQQKQSRCVRGLPMSASTQRDVLSLGIVQHTHKGSFDHCGFICRFGIEKVKPS